MTSVADLVGIMQDIDHFKGRDCKTCMYWYSIHGGSPQCRKGYGPAGEDDGCDDWRPRADRTAA